MSHGPSNGNGRVWLDELARERGWSRRKLDYLAAERRIVFWQDSPRGRRYTTAQEIANFERRGKRGNATAIAASNESRIEQIERRLAHLERKVLTADR